MDKLYTTQDVTQHNQRSFKRLVRAIALSQGQFSLILVRCNYAQLRQQILNQLQEQSQILIQSVSLDPWVSTLYTTLSSQLEEMQPSAVLVLGLEAVEALDQLLNSTNQVRDEFRKQFPFPLVLWITDDVATKMIRLAPDFKSWAAATIKFEQATCELIHHLEESAQTLWQTTKFQIKQGEQSQQRRHEDKTLSRPSASRHDFAPESRRRRELDSTWRDLQQRGHQLSPQLTVAQQFILGQDHDAQDQSDVARHYYQESFNRLQSRQQTTDLDSNLLCLQGILLFHIALTYRLQAARNPAEKTQLLQQAQARFQDCQSIFEQAARPDLVAGVMSYAGVILQRLQQWRELQAFAQQALKMHLTYGTPRQLAQDYGFLAEAALQQSKWQKANKLAKRALGILCEAEPLSCQGYYLLLLSRSYKHLQQPDHAIQALEIARAETEPKYDPQLYIDILAELRSIYYEQGQYLSAFRIKKQQREIEHQYGFRAFIGAHQLQPPKQVINPSSLVSEPQATIAEEMIASCRQQDINTLIQRIGRDDHKLIIIHGRSGVGKSSLVKAGLVPALKNISLNARNVAPVVLNVYTQWSRELERALTKAIVNQESLPQRKPPNLKNQWLQVISQAAHRPWHLRAQTLTPFILNPASFVVKTLQRNGENNLLTVLIFDQFEEFFFVNNSAEVRNFSNFLKLCLDFPFIKVVLSLREDYLHLLLECEELSNLDAINNNILDKRIRYSLKDFSKDEAKSVIKRLTKRAQFELEPDLVETLVEDLADDQGEVRPVELQVVGAQLQEVQEHGITTLADYQQLGTNPKAELIKHSIEQVIRDCGTENQAAAWDILFALTDEKLTRPLKTKQELMAAVHASSIPIKNRGKVIEERLQQAGDQKLLHGAKPVSFLEVILESGLILRWRQKPEDRYQLLHDYLVIPIRERYSIEAQKRQQEIQQRLHQAQAAKRIAEAAQKVSQKQLIHRNRLLKQLLCLSLAATIGLGLAAKTAYKQKQLANISTLTAASDALFFSHQKFDAILESMRAEQELKSLKRVLLFQSDIKDTELRIAATLQQAVYGVNEQNRLEGHTDVVWDVSFNPDSNLIASGGVDRTIKLWTPQGKLLHTFRSHQNSITSLQFSPDGRYLATSSHDKTIKIWDLNQLKQVINDNGQIKNPVIPLTLKGHQASVVSVAFSPTGEIIASASEDQSVKLWNLQGKLLRSLDYQAPLNWVRFSPDGEFIAVATDTGVVQLSTLKGKSVAKLVHSRCQDCRVYGVSFSPNGELIATAGADQTVKLWSRAGQLLRIFRGHTQVIYGVKFSPDGQTLASASADKTIKLWSLEGQLLQNFQGHGDKVTNISFSADGQTLASASYDKTVKLWQLNDVPLKRLQGHRDRVLTVSMSADGQLLASGSQDNTVKLWDRSGQRLQTLRGYGDRVAAVSLSPDGQFLATGSYDHTVQLWQLREQGTGVKGSARKTAEWLATWEAHQDSVMSVSFSPDSQFIATGGKDNLIRLWNRQGELVQTFRGHTGWVNSVQFSPDGHLLVSASDDGTVRIWTIGGKFASLYSMLSLQKEKVIIHAHNAYVLGVSFSPDGQTIASAGYDNTVKLWSREGKLLKTLLKGASDSVTSVSFSPDGQLIASASYDGRIRLWSRQSGTLLKTLMGHRGSVMSLQFSPDGQMLASASRDQSVILWNLNLDHLVTQACEWVGDYLHNNPNVSDEDRQLCDREI